MLLLWSVLLSLLNLRRWNWNGRKADFEDGDTLTWLHKDFDVYPSVRATVPEADKSHRQQPPPPPGDESKDNTWEIQKEMDCMKAVAAASCCCCCSKKQQPKLLLLVSPLPPDDDCPSRVPHWWKSSRGDDGDDDAWKCSRCRRAAASVDC